MADDRRNGEPLELVYVPESSWQPALIAFGLAAALAGLFTWWPYGVAGAIVALFALGAWIRDARQNFNRLPRKQRIVTAVIPAVPLQRTSKSDS
ncbi:MAG: hypothetical protein QOI10_474 [Solirubrobacterales bacterium]|jgi:hypothetical protein|nr:hypothetical protein [Solirubrobacterales bacterium]